MEDIRLLQRAKDNILALANGTDPFSGEELTEESVINNVRMSRCFFYIADILGKVIDNNGEIGKTVYRKEGKYIHLSDTVISSYPYSEEPIGINNIIKTLRSILGENEKPLSSIQITAWLLKEGYLAENIHAGKRVKVPTQKGVMLGIATKEGVNLQTGIPYRMNIYSSKAQRFIIENHNRILDEILSPEEER